MMKHPSRFYRNERRAEEEARAMAERYAEPFAVLRVGNRYTTRSYRRALSWTAVDTSATITRSVTQ